jgi:Flp pilus assembly protein TadG
VPKKRKGQSLVELALAMPLLCLLLLGTIDLGRLYFTYIDLKAAVRNGAGYGTLRPIDTAGMQSRVLNAGVPANTIATATCTGSCTTVDGTGTVVVTASSEFNPVTLSFFSWLGADDTITLSATAKMRVLS